MFKQTEIKWDLVITNNPNLLAWLRQVGIVDKTTNYRNHITEEIATGKNLIGKIPLYLASKCNYVMEVPIYIPNNLKGTKLSVDQIDQYAGNPIIYKVNFVEEVYEIESFENSQVG